MANLENEIEALEQRVTAADEEPTKLSYALLEKITDNFSNEIGRGAFGVVYMGVLKNARIAVKQLSIHKDFTDKIFSDEINCLIAAKHKNIVRLVGYCADAQGEFVKLNGRHIFAERVNRFLCFEYIPNGDLYKYLQGGVWWPSRYDVIKGICQGLKYLHSLCINHLDLKPQNILLDDNMEPKITDFGLSRHLAEGQSKIYTMSISGTMGWIAPEVINHGEISSKADIYALGKIIIQLVTGDLQFDDKNWHKFLNAECPKMKTCIEIAQRCVDADKQNRPDVGEILIMLKEVESNIQESNDPTSSISQGSNDTFNIYSEQMGQRAPRVNGQEPPPAPAVEKAPVSAELDLVPLSNLLRPLSISDLSPEPMQQSQLRVAYQGVPGDCSEVAAAKAYPGCDAIPCDQFEVAFQAVELSIADRAVLPVENSLGGSIHRNYDLLLRHRLHIVGEVHLPVHHCLLALPGVRQELLTRVISHPQVLEQCERTLNTMGLNVAHEAFDDTTGAAEHVAAGGLRDTGAIASARAAELYGLQVLADGIQDDAGNVTRFVMLAPEPIIPCTDRPFKTSIVFAPDTDGTSVLFKVLTAFALRGITITKIESRPDRPRPIRLVDNANVGTFKHFQYIFYIDFQASMADVRAQNALAEIHEFSCFLRVLGSYPMDTTQWDAAPSSLWSSRVENSSSNQHQ